MPESSPGSVQRGKRTGVRARYVGVFLVVGVLPLSAQSPAQRTQIEAFRDSIGAVSDSTALLVAEK